MTPEQRTGSWSAALPKAREGGANEAWAIALNATEKRSQCHIHMHIGKLFFSSRRRHTRCLSDWSSDRVLFRSDHIKMVPKELEAQMLAGKLSQTDAKGILYNVTPADERTIVNLKTLASTGQLTDFVLRHLVEDGAKLTNEQASLGVDGLLHALETPETLMFTLRNCYDID